LRDIRFSIDKNNPTPQVRTSIDVLQLDFVGPLYLKGKRQRSYILVCKDVFDGGRRTFIRLVTSHGNIHLLDQTFWVGKRLKGQYVKAVVDTHRGWLTVYLKSRLFKRWPYKFVNQ
jgi:hypothetical protein